MNAPESQPAPVDLPAEQSVRVLAPWERVFERFLTPFERFVEHQTTSGVLLLLAATAALVLANTGLADGFHRVMTTSIRLGVGSFSLDKSVHHWINDGLMTLFFFVVGLEIKRELLVGDLSRPRQAFLPIAAAFGGMVVPALLYLALVPPGDAARGWGIPMATDIAFAVGTVVLLGTRLPRSALTFLLALAIVDDLGALVVIALYYTSELNSERLALAMVVLIALVACNRFGLRRPWPYFVGGSLMWLLLLQSGVHATLAGVATAFTVPVLPKYHPKRFIDAFDKLVSRYKDAVTDDPSPLRNHALRSTLQTMENAVVGVRSPHERSLHRWEGAVAFLIMPLFALANASLRIDSESISTALHNPTALGVFVGLLVGKPLGICTCAWLCVRLRVCELPANLGWAHVFGLALLAGIGFTMSLFIGELAFDADVRNAAAAKFATLAASTVAGLAGYCCLRVVTGSMRTFHKGA